MGRCREIEIKLGLSHIKNSYTKISSRVMGFFNGMKGVGTSRTCDRIRVGECNSS